MAQNDPQNTTQNEPYTVSVARGSLWNYAVGALQAALGLKPGTAVAHAVPHPEWAGPDLLIPDQRITVWNLFLNPLDAQYCLSNSQSLEGQPFMGRDDQRLTIGVPAGMGWDQYATSGNLQYNGGLYITSDPSATLTPGGSST